MSEIKTEIEKCPEGETHTFGPDEYLITEKHTLSDIVRFAITQSDKDEIQAILDLEEE